VKSWQPGDRVVIRAPGSWCDGKEAVVLKADVTSSDGRRGPLLRVPGEGVTVVPPGCLEAAPAAEGA
jgi:hypothetical protein